MMNVSPQGSLQHASLGDAQSQIQGPSHFSTSFTIPASRNPRVLACVLCQQRKVKCDRKVPCSNCVRANAQCVSSTPAPPRRRRKRIGEGDLLARLRRYEAQLKSYGATIDDPGDLPDVEEHNGHEGHDDHEGSSDYSSPNKEQSSVKVSRPSGKMITEPGKSKYLDNSLWTDLRDELPDSKGMLDQGSEDAEVSYPDIGSLLLDAGPSGADLSEMHPQPVQVFQLWQFFLDNVNPLTKLFHAPTIQQSILQASNNLKTLPKNMQALLFAIYAAAVNSLTDQECKDVLSQNMAQARLKYHRAALRALQRAEFLCTSDHMVLQAFTLFLVSARAHYDSQSLWMLSGVAVRMAQGMGLHRDPAQLHFPPFEVEMRRRLWWQIVLVDSRLAQLCGVGTSVLGHEFDTKMPSNVNDSDLNLEMRELPPPPSGTTEMVFCLLRYEIGEFLRRATTKPAVSSYDGYWNSLSSSSTPADVKDAAIDEFEKLLDDKYIRYCDPLIPLHFLTIGVCRAALCKMRLVAHHPQRYAGGVMGMPPADRELLFSNCVHVVDFDNLAHASKNQQKYLWHVQAHFQIDAFIFIISDLRFRTAGPIVDKAWRLVYDMYENHPELLSRNPLYVAVGNLTLKAWEERQKQSSQHDNSMPSAPPFIQRLLSQRRPVDLKAKNPFREMADASHKIDFMPVESYLNHIQQESDVTPSTASNTFEPPSQGQFDPMSLLDSLPMDTSPIDWTFWDQMLENSDIQAFDMMSTS